MPKHGEYQPLGMIREKDALTGMVVYEASSGKTWCDHCQSWVQTDGVMGGLEFMAHHRDGDCKGKQRV